MSSFSVSASVGLFSLVNAANRRSHQLRKPATFEITESGPSRRAADPFRQEIAREQTTVEQGSS